MASLRVLRWILVALTATLAVILIASGHVLVGVVLGAIAVTRAIMFVTLQRRRSEFRARIAERRASGLGRGGFGRGGPGFGTGQ